MLTENNAENNSHGNTEPDHFVRFTNDHMFCSVMSDDQICIDFLNTILDLNITSIIRHENQKAIDPNLTSHGVRLDVYVEDENNVIYDIEMQVVNRKNLEKRSRYYQSLIDQDILPKADSYDQLKQSFVIFICMFDPYDHDQFVYSVKSSITCSDGTVIPFDDGTHRILIFPGGHYGNVSEDFRNLMNYINKSIVRGELTERINKSVLQYNESKEWRHAHMTYEMKMKETYNDGVAFGKIEGIAIGEAKGIAIGKVLLLWEDITHDFDTIAKKTGVSVDEVKRILKEANCID